MGQDPLPLTTPARPARSRMGAARAAMERTLRAWSGQGHLVGDGTAAERRVLRDAADAVDAAHDAMAPARCQACGAPVKGAFVGSPGALAYANNIHAALIAAARPQADAGPDPYGSTDNDDALSAAVAAAFAPHGEPPAPPGDAAGHGIDG